MMALAIETSHSQRIRRDIAGIEIGQAGNFDRQSNGDSATTGPDIGHHRERGSCYFTLDLSQSSFNQQFCFRSGDQDTWVHYKIEAVEFFVAHQIGYRLSLPAPLDKLKELC